ncbi:uncharacterized protein LOC143039000 [Oratosquilla oratoria]|uniref:uncharacterized protein LOC143039000 n=1 Tax=Oratosquilla oratoria TaxID=337810 RepID=UPI003F775F22
MSVFCQSEHIKVSASNLAPLQGRKFYIYTDHKPLTTTFLSNKSSCSPRQLYHTDFTSQFTTDLRYIRGTDNSQTDAHSHNISAVTSSFIDYAAIAADQTADPELQELLSNPAFQFKKILLPGTDVHIYADVSTETSPATFTPVSSRFKHVHIDIVGPLPFFNGYCYILTCVDRFTRWAEAAPLVDINTDSVAHTLINTWISRFGVPLRLNSDRGGQFESNVWNKFMNILGIQRIRTASYHPQANGIMERFHRQLTVSLTTSIQRED